MAVTQATIQFKNGRCVKFAGENIDNLVFAEMPGYPPHKFQPSQMVTYTPKNGESYDAKILDSIFATSEADDIFTPREQWHYIVEYYIPIEDSGVDRVEHTTVPENQLHEN